MTEAIAHCHMCDKEKMCTDHHEHFIDEKVKMCDDCQTMFHRYLRYLELYTEDSPNPFKYEKDKKWVFKRYKKLT